MDYTLLFITILGTLGGFIASSFASFGATQGWTVGNAFREKGIMTIVGGITAFVFIILSAVYNEWWTLFIVLLSAIILTQVMIRIFKGLSQLLSVALLIVGVVWFTGYVLI